MPATKIALREFAPLHLVALRYIATVPFFVPVLLAAKRPPTQAFIKMALLGVVGIGVGQTLQALAIGRTSSSAASVINAMTPILVVIVVGFLVRKRLRVRHAAGLAIAFVGVSLVAVGDPLALLHAFDPREVAGDGMMLASALAIALQFGLSVNLVERYSAIVVTSWMTLAGAIALAPFLLAGRDGTRQQWTILAVSMISYLAVLVSAVGVWVWLIVLQRVQTELAAALFYMQPVVGVLLSKWIFGDSLGSWFLLGTAFVLGGIALSVDARVHEPGGRYS